jgi:hypothetical protein
MIKYFCRSLIPGLLLVLGTSSLLNAAAWQQPPTQFTTDNQGREIDGATDGNGNAISLWTDAGTDTVEASYFSNGAWGAPQILNNLAATEGLAVAMDGTGTGLAVWIEDGTGAIESAHFSGGVWTTPTPAVLDAPPTAFSIDVSMDGSGNGVAIWTDLTLSQIKSSFYTAGTNSWSAFTVLGTGDDASSVSYSASGTAIATWLNAGVVTASYYNGTIWLAPVVLGSASDSVVSGIDASGNAIAAWVDTATGNVLSSTIIGAIVTGPTLISAGPGNSEPSLAVAPGGTAVLTWRDGAATGQYSTFNGTTWAAPLQFAPEVSGIFSTRLTASVSVDNNGNALIVYGTSNSEIFSVQIPLGGTVGPTLFVTNNINGANESLLDIVSALSDNGTGFAFWLPSSEGPNVFASVLIADAPPGGLTVTICKNKFASQVDLVYILTWTPSSDPATVSYYLRRNGVLIAIIPASGPFIFYDHNRNRRVVDVYTLTAVTAGGIESSPVSVTVN